ncbi:MAG: tetratricopeptide repeat-containing sensor histidine kinase, partial [Crocinitomicaceae bacterium]
MTMNQQRNRLLAGCRCAIVLLFFGMHSLGFAQQKVIQQLKNADVIYDSERGFQFVDSIRKYVKLNPETRVLLLEKLAVRCLETDRYNLLSKYSIEGIQLARALGKDSSHAFFYKFLGISQNYNRKVDDAISSFKSSIRIAEANHLNYILATNYNNIGGILVDRKQFDEAEKYLLKSIELSTKNGMISKRNQLMSSRILATLYVRMNKKEKCIPIFEMVERESRLLKDTNLICGALVFYTEFLRQNNQKELALKKVEEAVVMMRKFPDKHSLFSTLSTYVSLLEELKRYPEAYEISREQLRTYVAIYNDVNQQQMNELETRFKTQQWKEAQKLAAANANALKKKNQLYVLILAVLIALIVIVVLLIYVRNQKRKNALLRFVQQERLGAIVEGEEKERSRIARELHDGVVQELTALKLQLRATDLEQNEQLANFYHRLDQTAHEIRNISYEMMPVTLRDLGLIPALEDLLQRSFNTLEIDFEIDTVGMEERLPEKVETAIFRITQEL